LKETKEEIVRHVENQVAKKMSMKKGYRKKIKQIVEPKFRKLLYQVFSPKNMVSPHSQANSIFGYDEFGRDIEQGLRQYVSILKSRKVQIHTVIVLGSRVKSSWKPESDIDVTIVASNLPKEGRNFLSYRLRNLRRGILLSDRPLFMGIEPSGCCSPEEFLQKMERFDLQILDALLYGQIVYDDGFWSQAKLLYEKIAKKHGLETAPLKKIIAPV